MKVAAHPLVVAVALGLIGPSALDGLQARHAAMSPSSTRDVVDAEPPGAEERARAASAFAEAREGI